MKSRNITTAAVAKTKVRKLRIGGIWCKSGMGLELGTFLTSMLERMRTKLQLLGQF